MRYFWGYLDTESEVILRIIGPIYWIFEIVVDVGKSWIGMECNKDKKNSSMKVYISNVYTSFILFCEYKTWNFAR